MFSFLITSFNHLEFFSIQRSITNKLRVLIILLISWISLANQRLPSPQWFRSERSLLWCHLVVGNDDVLKTACCHSLLVLSYCTSETTSGLSRRWSHLYVCGRKAPCWSPWAISFWSFSCQGVFSLGHASVPLYKKNKGPTQDLGEKKNIT